MSTNVVGNGLIAKAIKSNIKDNNAVIYFASGVSNSMCTNESEFERERNLLHSTINKFDNDMIFVYFSTCSVYDDIIVQTNKYVHHKISMEKIVLDRGNSYVFRLPQLAGISENKYTLLNYLRDSIVNDININLQVYATRNVIDVVDIIYFVNEILRSGIYLNTIINIACSYSISVEKIIIIFENIINKKARINRIYTGYEYDIDIGVISGIMQNNKKYFGDEYYVEVLNKYYSSTRSVPYESTCMRYKL